MTPAASIEVIVGCMFSGKTSALFDRIARSEALSLRWRLFKHCIDDRYGADSVTTHNGKCRRAVMASNAHAVMRSVDGADLVAIDEGHFFDHALPQACARLAERGVSVVVTALDRDSWGRPFGGVTALCAVATEVTFLHGTCARCHAPASCTQRLAPIIDGHMVGGPEAYEPRCERCFRPPAEPPPAPAAAPPSTHREFRSGSSVARP